MPKAVDKILMQPPLEGMPYCQMQVKLEKMAIFELYLAKFLWPPSVIAQGIIFLSCGFFFFLFFPRLILTVTDWMSTILTTHDVALVQI